MLSSCTGSEESRSSTLLLVGFGVNVSDSINGKIGLLDTCLLTSTVSDNCPSVTLVNDNNQKPFLVTEDLPENSEAIDFDIVERGNKRSEIVVLSAKGKDSNRTAYVSFFRLTNIDPRPQKAQLIQSRSFITLTVESLAIDTDIKLKPASFCPTQAQISAVNEEARYVVFFNDQTICQANLTNAISIIDLKVNPPKLIKHFELGNSVPKGFYMSQQAKKLYFLQISGGDQELTSLSLEGDINDNTEEKVITFSNKDEVVDMKALGSNFVENKLAILNEKDFIIIDNFSTEPVSQSAIETPSNPNKQIISDDLLRTQNFYFLTNSRFVLYASPESGNEPKDISVSAVSGAYESINDFIYLLSNKTIYKFDARNYNFDTTPRFSGSFTITDLSNPKFVTWVQAVAAE